LKQGISLEKDPVQHLQSHSGEKKLYIVFGGDIFPPITYPQVYRCDLVLLPSMAIPDRTTYDIGGVFLQQGYSVHFDNASLSFNYIPIKVLSW
jgi:hypothetical protein